MARPVMLAFVVSALSCAPARDRPHIILISIDALRPDHLGIYGYERRTSANIDAWFAKGTTFEQALTASPCTIPAVEQLLVGANDPLGRERLAELLEHAGYQTGAVVSHHFFRNRQGPDEKYARGFNHFDVQGQAEVDQHEMTTRTASRVTAGGLGWLRQHRGGGKPLFLWLHYFDPHDPYLPPEADRIFWGRPAPGIDGDRRTAMQRAKKPGQAWFDAGDLFTAEQALYLAALYDGEIHYADREVSRVLRALDDLDLTGRALVILTADHGERLGEGGAWDHCQSLAEVEMRVPLLVRYRGGPMPRVGSRSNAVVSNLDIVPTVLAAAGVRGSGFDGVPFGRGDADRVIIAGWQKQWMARDSSWKLRVEEGRTLRVWPMSGDVDVSAEDVSQPPELDANGRAARRHLLQELRRRSPGADWLEKTQEIMEELAAIGYVD